MDFGCFALAKPGKLFSIGSTSQRAEGQCFEWGWPSISRLLLVCLVYMHCVGEFGLMWISAVQLKQLVLSNICNSRLQDNSQWRHALQVFQERWAEIKRNQGILMSSSMRNRSSVTWWFEGNARRENFWLQQDNLLFWRTIDFQVKQCAAKPKIIVVGQLALCLCIRMTSSYLLKLQGIDRF